MPSFTRVSFYQSFCVKLHAQEVGRGQNVSDLELMRADSRNGELSSYFDVASSNNTNSLVSGKVVGGWVGRGGVEWVGRREGGVGREGSGWVGG